MRGFSSRLVLVTALVSAVAITVAAPRLGRAAVDDAEPPMLAERVRAGELPTMARRLPETPLVVDLARAGREPGRYGGSLRMLTGRARDTRLMVVHGYARLVGYDTDLEIKPDILERLDVEGDRVFTLHLRRGHKWSDGHPFTSEDFRYFWQDVADDGDISPVGPPREMVVEGETPKFEVLNATTVRYTWSRPNPFFLPALAAAMPLDLFRPAHYLKGFHARYADKAELARLVAESGQRNWVALHYLRDRMYKNDDPDMPTLQPWMLTTRPPAQRFVFVRNPYFHRVDERGRQLPYIDQVVMTIANPKLIPAKTGAGEADLQARGIQFNNYTFLKQGEKRNGYTVRPWRTAVGAHVALFPNLNVGDPVWRTLVRNADFRRALSLAIDRHEINQVIYYGLADEGGDTVLKGSSLFKEDLVRRWAVYDPVRANALLDDLGLTQRGADGVRLLADGRPAAIVVETAGEDPEQTDVLQLVHDTWLKVGIKLYTKPLQREVLRNRIFAGSTLMSVWSGLENAIPTPESSPDELAPTSQMQLQWPKWGQYYETMGKAGEAVDEPAARRLAELRRAWRYADNRTAKRAIWEEMLATYANQVYTIGIIRGVPQPVVVSDRLRNVPADAVFTWDPGAQFGVYRPDTFWFADVAETVVGR